MKKPTIIWLVSGAFIAVLASAFVINTLIDTPVPHIDIPWNGARAMSDIGMQLSVGPRALGLLGHEVVVDFIRNELAKTSATVTDQKWTYKTNDGKEYGMTNLIARFDPSNARRIIIGTHYDSMIRAYRDVDNPYGYMPGANNSASGVAFLLETARALAAAKPMPVGVDVVFFDGEEGPRSLGAGDPDWVALGSPHFAEHLGELYPDQKPEEAIVFDMVCYKDMKLKPELFSLTFARKKIKRFWRFGAALAPSIFAPRATPRPIGDDQLALSKAGIPSFLVVGFEYEPWFNTTQDTIDKCSPQVMEGLGKTLLTYLYAE